MEIALSCSNAPFSAFSVSSQKPTAAAKLRQTILSAVESVEIDHHVCINYNGEFLKTKHRILIRLFEIRFFTNEPVPTDSMCSTNHSAIDAYGIDT